MVPSRVLFRLHFGCISEALDSALGPWGTLGEVLEVSETGLGIYGFSVIIQGGSRIRSTLKVEGDSVVWGILDMRCCEATGWDPKKGSAQEIP